MDERLKALNEELKNNRCGVQVRRKGNRLYLRATLPPKPGSAKDKPHQQEISLGCYANPAGYRRAKAEALRLSGDLAMGKFSWDTLIKNSQPTKTAGDWITAFERDYFSRRERNPKSQTTWDKDYWASFKRLVADQALTKDAILEAIAQTSPDTRSRQRVCMALGALAKFAGIDVDVAPLRGKYSPKAVQARDLPSDELIAEWRERIPNPAWQWAYGVIAAYGLRNHEVFYVELESIRRSELLTVLDSKTGPRKVLPCLPEWWELWGLAEPQVPKVTGRNNRELGMRVTQYFRRLELPFRVYDLRHAWAARTAARGLDPAIAARMQGHSLQVHTAIYHQFLNDAHLLEAWKRMRD